MEEYVPASATFATMRIRFMAAIICDPRCCRACPSREDLNPGETKNEPPPLPYRSPFLPIPGAPHSLPHSPCSSPRSVMLPEL